MIEQFCTDSACFVYWSIPILCLTRITRIAEKCFHELHELKKSFHEYEYTNIRISQIVVYHVQGNLTELTEAC